MRTFLRAERAGGLMRTRISLFAMAALSLGSAIATAAQQAEPAAPKPLMVTIDTAKTADPVSKYEFGMFIEHHRATHLSQPVGGDARRPEILLPDLLQGSARLRPRRRRIPTQLGFANGGLSVPTRRSRWTRIDRLSGEQSPRIELDSSTSARHPPDRVSLWSRVRSIPGGFIFAAPPAAKSRSR